MYLKEFLALVLALCATPILAINFSNSYWIWTNEASTGGSYPPGSRAFRNDFCPPEGKTPAFANVIITTDDEYTLFVNGNEVGSVADWPAPGAYCVQLTAGCNVFAVTATNFDGPGNNPAGVLAAVDVVYTDGTTSSIVTDGSWRTFGQGVPTGFQQVGFDDSAWPHAVVEGSYGAGPWDFLALPPSPSATFLHLSDANWIWTDEVDDNSAPVGSRAFRKEIILPPGITATSAFVTISVDDEYDLFVQGNLVGSGSDWEEAQIYNVDLPSPASEIVIAINATNTGGQAGLISTIQLTLENNGCGPYASVITDDTWKYTTVFSDGFQAPGFDDSDWSSAIVEGPYGSGVWGDVPVGAPGTGSPFGRP